MIEMMPPSCRFKLFFLKWCPQTVSSKSSLFPFGFDLITVQVLPSCCSALKRVRISLAFGLGR